MATASIRSSLVMTLALMVAGNARPGLAAKDQTKVAVYQEIARLARKISAHASMGRPVAGRGRLRVGRRVLAAPGMGLLLHIYRYSTIRHLMDSGESASDRCRVGSIPALETHRQLDKMGAERQRGGARMAR